VPGRYSGISSIAAGSRFEPGRSPYNAIQVSLKKKGTLYFGAMMMAPPVIGTTATASAQAEAAFSVGSRLASLNGGVLNALLGGLLGTNISLSVMDYNALISADVDTAAAALANGTNEVQLNLGATIPGLTSTTLSVAIGEPPQSSPWLSVGGAGTVVRTAQTRIKLNASVRIGNGNGNGNGSMNLGGGIKLLSINLPLNVEVAYAEAKLSDISCPTGASRQPEGHDRSAARRRCRASGG
jgi:uncharacterized membrane protein